MVSPADVLGARLLAWYKADAITGLTDGQGVATWADSSGNGHTAVQATGSRQPIYKTGIVNGLPVLRYDGVDDGLVATGVNNAQPTTIIAIASMTRGTAFPYLYDGTTTSGRNALFGSSSTVIQAFAGSGINAPATYTGVPAVHTTTYSGATSSYRRDGGSATVATTGTQPLTGLTIGAQWQLNSGNSLPGDYLELLVISGALTDAERALLHSYAQDKWAITVADYTAAPTPAITADSIALTTALTPLTVPSYTTPAHVLHPDVVDTVTGWNGYRYWMTHTPYPNGNNSFENPSVYASTDGLTWVTPAGGSNPVVLAPTSPAFNSDPDLILVGGTMHLIYRYSAGGSAGVSAANLFLRTSTDGVTWTAPASVLSGVLDEFTSPAILHDGTTWHMWVLDTRSGAQKVVYRTATTLGTWTTVRADCLFDGWPSTRLRWHMDVIKVGSTFIGLIQDRANTSVFGGLLRVCTSADGSYWKVAAQPLIAANASQTWYRSCLLKTGAGSYKFWLTEYQTTAGTFSPNIQYAEAAVAEAIAQALTARGGSLSVIGGSLTGVS